MAGEREREREIPLVSNNTGVQILMVVALVVAVAVIQSVYKYFDNNEQVHTG